jgi:phosphoglycolate phosphatase-like HAD superfamily hydrolase
MTVRKITTMPARRRRMPPQPWTSAEVFVFDVEGTLVDAMMPTLRCWRETLDLFGHDISLAELHALAGMDGEEMLRQLLPGVSKNERQDILERQGARFREEYLPHIPAFPGVRALFEDLKRHGCKIALATDCAKDQLRHYLEVAKIEGLVDAFGCGDDVRRGKPAPAVLETALRRVRAGHKLAVLVGDTPFDAATARKCRVISVGVLTGHFSEPALREAGCHAVLGDITALRAALARTAAGADQLVAPAA